MRAVVCSRYGPPEVLRLEEVEKPTPRVGQLLIRIHAATVTAGDCELRGMRFPLPTRLLLRLAFGVRGPRKRILGQELAGQVEAIGAGVTRFKPGDPVFAATGFALGAYAEYTCLPETGVIAMKPATIPYEGAAAVPVAALEALYFLKAAKLQSGQRVLINGAGGSIGTFAIQLAKARGAVVTGVDSTGKQETMRSIGADHVIDYTREEFGQNGETYDVIFDVTGGTSLRRVGNTLKRGGYFLSGNSGLLGSVRGHWTARRTGKSMVAGAARHRVQDLEFLTELLDSGTVRPVIDRRYSLEQIVEAHRYVETGLKKGNVVIVCDSPADLPGS